MESNQESIKSEKTWRVFWWGANRFFMMIWLSNFMMKLTQILKIDSWCSVEALSLECFLYAIVRDRKAIASELFQREKRLRVSANTIVVKYYESRIWLIKNEISGKPLCQKVKKARDHTFERGRDCLLQKYGRGKWHTLSKPYQPVSAWLRFRTSKARYLLGAQAWGLIIN